MSPRSSVLLAVPHAPPASPPALSSCFQNTTDTEHVHNASAQPQRASLDPVIDSRRADSAYASAPATSITVRRANSAPISVAVTVALAPSYPALPEAHGSPSKLPSRARDIPKPLMELHAPSRSASPQAARRDYSERAFSVAAVAPTSSTSLSASSASPMLASKSTCTLLPPHLTAPEMGSVRSASFAGDLLPLHPVGSRLDTLPTEQRSTLPKIDGTRPHQSSKRHRLRGAEIVSRNRTSGRCQLASSFDPVQHASVTARPLHQRVRYNDKDPPWRVGAHPDNAARAMHGYAAFRTSTLACSAFVLSS
ncbi:hypothetical protein K438DRAFT_1963020 [Mycena galopus ATCC 62051]|nr:hypothetical protein K438DRAFT_1963020 [Mycena galopus ATCC 62051]